MTLNYFSETGEHLKQQNINCFPYVYIRLFSPLALMREMENATVTTLQGCESKFRHRSNRY